MAVWKKIIVSGSSANLPSLQIDNLTSGSVVIGGGGNNLTTTAINGTGNIVATTGATGLIASGSFSGSFAGNFTGVFTGNGSYAVSASYALSASAAVSSSYALSASFATNSTLFNGLGSSIFATTGSNTFSDNQIINGTLSVSQSATFNSVIINGDLTVAGTASFTNADNLRIRDKFILINSGSTTLADSGFISQYNAAGSGSAFFLESINAGTYGRFAVAYDAIGTTSLLAPDEYIVSVKIDQASSPSANPTWGGSSNGSGNMWITTAGDVFIYA
jgi:hypothetical protein